MEHTINQPSGASLLDKTIKSWRCHHTPQWEHWVSDPNYSWLNQVAVIFLSAVQNAIFPPLGSSVGNDLQHPRGWAFFQSGSSHHGGVAPCFAPWESIDIYENYIMIYIICSLWIQVPSGEVFRVWFGYHRIYIYICKIVVCIRVMTSVAKLYIS